MVKGAPPWSCTQIKDRAYIFRRNTLAYWSDWSVAKKQSFIALTPVETEPEHKYSRYTEKYKV